MLILQEGAGVYSPVCRDPEPCAELKEWKDAPCFAAETQTGLQKWRKGSPTSRSSSPPRFDNYNLPDHLCIAQLSLRHYNLLCFDFLSFPLNHVVSNPSCYEALFQLSIFLYHLDKYFREWARKALNWNISCKGLLESQYLLNNNKHLSVVTVLTDLFCAPVSA